MKTKLLISIIALALTGCGGPSRYHQLRALDEANRAEIAAEYDAAKSGTDPRYQRDRAELVAAGVQPAGMSDAEFAQRREHARQEAEDRAATARAAEQAVFTRAVLSHPEWSQEIIELVRNKQINVGMPGEAVEASWGRPERKLVSDGIGGQTATWFYHSGTLFFVENRLARWTLDR